MCELQVDGGLVIDAFPGKDCGKVYGKRNGMQERGGRGRGALGTLTSDTDNKVLFLFYPEKSFTRTIGL